jgi:hypothetical protein
MQQHRLCSGEDFMVIGIMMAGAWVGGRDHVAGQDTWEWKGVSLALS